MFFLSLAIIAKAAEGGSCEALREASDLDARIKELGVRCVSHLQKLREAHQKVFFRFGTNRGLHDTLHSTLFQLGPFRKGCRNEHQLGQGMGRQLASLGRSVAGTDHKSESATQDYSRFVQAAEALQKVAGSAGTGCSQALSSVKNSLGRSAVGSPARKAASPSASDITGTSPRRD